MSPILIFIGIIIAFMGWELWIAKFISIIGPNFLTPLGFFGWTLIGQSRNDATVNQWGIIFFGVGLFIIILGIIQTSEKNEPVSLDEEEEEEEEGDIL